MIHLKKSSDGQYYFVVRATNGKILTKPDMYPRKRNAERAANVLLALVWDGTSIQDKTA